MKNSEMTALTPLGHRRAARVFVPRLLALACVVKCLLSCSSASAAPRQTLTGHMPQAVAALQPIGRPAPTQHLGLTLSLPLRNQQSLANLLDQLSDPASSTYRQYLSCEQFTERFGPSQEDYEALIAFARANGLAVTAAHPNRMLLEVNGAVADVERAFHVNLRLYQHTKEARTFYAPDAEPSLDLEVPVLHVNGLDNFARPHANHRAKPLDIAANVTGGTGSGPYSFYMGSDFRAAYLPGVSLTGTGQTVALLEFDGYYTGDITTYESMAKMTNIPLQNVVLDGVSGLPGYSGDTNNVVEVSLDIEMAIAMAPGLSKVIVYEGAYPADVLSRMATDNLAKQLSCSWGWTPSDPTVDQIFQEFRAQGQSFFAASGDSDAYTGTIPQPSDDPNITIVGGTTLTTSGPGGTWVSETVWNWGYVARDNAYEGTGGGMSTSFTLPSWQQHLSMSANLGSTTMRNIPDVALTADNIFVVANNNRGYGDGGTSCAAPLWAGLAALINQRAKSLGYPTAGFLNPSIYALGKGTGYSTAFHDITTGNNINGASPNNFYAAAGYDLASGWGTPAGMNLINALAVADAPPTLHINRSGTNVVVTWPSIATGYTLQSADDLGRPAWVNVSQSAVVANDLNTVTVPATKAKQFFRLRGP